MRLGISNAALDTGEYMAGESIFLPICALTQVGQSYCFGTLGVWQLEDSRVYAKEGLVLPRGAVAPKTAESQ